MKLHCQIILCHPNPESFNHAISQRVAAMLQAQGHQVICHDLYQEGFNPVLSYAELTTEPTDPLLQRHLQELQQTDLLIIIHPNWWGKPPALLAGWIDRVFRLQKAYTFPKGAEGGEPIGLLPVKKAIIFNTSNTTLERESTVFGDPLERIWRHCILAYCGIPHISRKVFRVIVDSSLEERHLWLAEAEEIVLASIGP